MGRPSHAAVRVDDPQLAVPGIRRGHPPAQLSGLRGVHGASDSLRDPAVNSMLAEYGGKGSMASTFAWYQTTKTAGSFGASPGGLLIATTLGFPFAFAAAFALSFLPALPWPWLVPPCRRIPAVTSRRRTQHPARPSQFGRRRSVRRSQHSTGSLGVSGPTRTRTHRTALGRLSHRVGRPVVLSVRDFANVFSSLVYLLAANLAGVWTGKALDDMGKAAFRPAWGSMMADVANRDPKTRARAMGFLTAGEDAGTLAAPLLASLLWTLWGVPVLLFARVAVAAISELYATGLQRRQRRGFHPRSGIGGDREPRGPTEPGRCDACGGDASGSAPGEPGEARDPRGRLEGAGGRSPSGRRLSLPMDGGAAQHDGSGVAS